MVEDQDTNHQDIEMHPHLQEVDLQAEVVVIIVHQVDHLRHQVDQLRHQVDQHQVHREIQLLL